MEAIAYGLMQHLANKDRYSYEGKMGVLLVELPAGEQRVLKAFSGLLNGHNVVEGWVPMDEIELPLETATPWLSWRLSSRNSLLLSNFQNGTSTKRCRVSRSST